MPTRDIPPGDAFVAGDTAPTVRTKLNGNLAWAEAQMQGIEDRLEGCLAAIAGSGVLSGLVVSAGGGLSVEVSAGAAIIGHVVTKPAAATGVAVAAEAESFVYLLQDGGFATNATGAPPTGQASILLAAVTADADSVTAVDNEPPGKERLGLGASGLSAIVDAGTVTVGADKLGADLLVPFDAILNAARLHARVAPTGADLIVDLNLNGASLWAASPDRRVRLADGETAGLQTRFDAPAVSAGDRLTVDVDQVGSTTPGSGLTLAVEFRLAGLSL